MPAMFAIVLLFAAGPVLATPEVARAQFTSAVSEREPVDALERASVSDGRVRFFTELRGLAGSTVVHRWEHEGRVMAEVAIEVGADRWRAWSSKRILPAWTGVWQVSVIGDDGTVLGTWTLLID